MVFTPRKLSKLCVKCHCSWFKKYPEVFSHFKPLFKDLNINNVDGHPTMRAQVRVFNDAMTSYVDNLDDVELLIILVQKLTKSHVSKGIHIKDFQVCNSTHFLLEVNFLFIFCLVFC